MLFFFFWWVGLNWFSRSYSLCSHSRIINHFLVISLYCWFICYIIISLINWLILGLCIHGCFRSSCLGSFSLLLNCTIINHWFRLRNNFSVSIISSRINCGSICSIYHACVFFDTIILGFICLIIYHTIIFDTILSVFWNWWLLLIICLSIHATVSKLLTAINILTI